MIIIRLNTGREATEDNIRPEFGLYGAQSPNKSELHCLVWLIKNDILIG